MCFRESCSYFWLMYKHCSAFCMRVAKLIHVVIVSLAHIQVRWCGVRGPSSSSGVLRTPFGYLSSSIATESCLVSCLVCAFAIRESRDLPPSTCGDESAIWTMSHTGHPLADPFWQPVAWFWAHSQISCLQPTITTYCLCLLSPSTVYHYYLCLLSLSTVYCLPESPFVNVEHNHQI